MLDRKNQSIDLLTEGGFSISEPGPLHAPLHIFKIWRDERLSLRLETEAALDAKSAAPLYPDGTLRFSTDKVELSAVSGAKATFFGVETVATSRNKVLRETAQFHELRVTLRDHESAAYTIEWLENFPVKYCWPHSMQTIEEDDVKFSLSLEDKGLTVHGPGSRFGLSQAAVRLTVAGHTFYVCGPSQVEEKRTTRSGPSFMWALLTTSRERKSGTRFPWRSESISSKPVTRSMTKNGTSAQRGDIYSSSWVRRTRAH